VPESPESRPQPRGGISLVAFLGAALFFELWLNRIVARTLRRDPSGPLERFARKIDLFGLYLFELTSVLGALLLGGAILQVVGSPRHRGPFRLSMAIVGGVTTVLIAVGTFTRLPPRLHAHLYLSALFLLFVIVLGTLALPSTRALRAGVAVLAVPVCVMLAANLIQRMNAPGVLDPRASLLAESAGALLIACGLASPWLLGPEGPGGPLAAAAGALTLGGGLGLGWVDWDLAARLAGIGLGVAIPLGRFMLPLYVLAASALVYTAFALMARPGPERLRGVGVFLIGAVGLQLELPYQIAGSLIGFVCLLESAARPALGAITRDELDASLRAAGTQLGTAHITVVGPSGRERARLHFSAPGGLPGVLCVDRRGGAIARVELSVGEIPPRTPPFTVAARGTRLGPSAPGPAIATDDSAFDAQFVVRDRRGAGGALLDAETRAQLLREAKGWVGVWPTRGARFVGRTLVTDERLPALAQLLAHLCARSAT
jgi:hypothetical protein